MSTNAVHSNGAENATISQKINDFLTKNRVVLVTVLAVLLCGFVVTIAYITISGSNKEKAFLSVDTVLENWETLKASKDQSNLSAKEDEMISTLKSVANANKNSYAGERAYNTIAEIYFSRKDWKNAQEQYLAAVKALPKGYTSGINYFNAAVCADELGKPEEALGYYTKASELENFPLKSRAMFNIGRIQEQMSRKADAIATYGKITEQFPDDQWALLAKSRTIALQLQK
jgi:tetratricopeptide (TPR) repeat protein